MGLSRCEITKKGCDCQGIRADGVWAVTVEVAAEAVETGWRWPRKRLFAPITAASI